MCEVPAFTDHDLDLCHSVGELGYPVTCREVRTLREYGAIVTTRNRSGGRGKAAPYGPGSARVVAAIQLAKRHELYKRKLWRAVLIAWRRRAPVGTDGLRRAFHEFYEEEERTALHLVEGRRVEGEPELDLAPGLYKAIAAAQLGHTRTADAIAVMEKETGPTVRAAFWRSGNRNLLPDDPSTMGFAKQRTDGSWAVTEMADQLWDVLALAPLRKIARTAPRKELDAALPLSIATPQQHGFQYSELLDATGVPIHVQWMRRWYGDRWWTRRTT